MSGRDLNLSLSRRRADSQDVEPRFIKRQELIMSFLADVKLIVTK